MGTCPHCARPVLAKGLCNAHYKKLMKYGDPLAGRTDMRGAPKLERYLAKVDRRGDDECWPWLAHRNRDGYGTFGGGARADGESTGSHRFGFSVLVRALGPDEVVDHICHNRDDSCPGGNTCEHRACQNPAHWEAVSGEMNRERGKSIPAANSRKTRCKWGHALVPGNIYWTGPNKDRRQCRACAILSARGRHPRQLMRLATA